jgi:hypothetical protein
MVTMVSLTWGAHVSPILRDVLRGLWAAQSQTHHEGEGHGFSRADQPSNNSRLQPLRQAAAAPAN